MGYVVVFLVTVFAGIAVHLFVDAIEEFSKWLIWRAAKRLPPRLRRDFRMGWEGDLATLATKVLMLRCALGACKASYTVEPLMLPLYERWTIRFAAWGLATRIDALQLCARMRPKLQEGSLALKLVKRIDDRFLTTVMLLSESLVNYLVVRDVRRSREGRPKVISRTLRKTVRPIDLQVIAICSRAHLSLTLEEQLTQEMD